MNMITRHNYEEYFILYMDNELGSEDRRMVEAFIKQHPDLEDELHNLLQYKLEPDTSLTFTGKEELMKLNGESPVPLSNYEEWLVLYTDNELSAAQKLNVEQFAAANPAVQKELDLLLKTKLQPEAIVFHHKESLYRREVKVRAIPVRWWRAAAAVLLLGLGLTTAMLLAKKSTTGDEKVATVNGNEKGTTPGTGPAEIITPEKTGNPVATVKENNSPVINTSATGNEKEAPAPVIYRQAPAIAQKDNKAVPEKKLPVNMPAPERNEIAVTDNKPSNNLPQPINNPNINKSNTPKDAIAANNTPINTNQPEKALTNPVVTTGNPQPSDIVQTSFNDEGASSGKKNKLRGFFRKVTRTFEKRTNIDATDGQDRLLVAGLSIKMK